MGGSSGQKKSAEACGVMQPGLGEPKAGLFAVAKERFGQETRLIGTADGKRSVGREVSHEHQRVSRRNLSVSPTVLPT
jgi:hypothetical protein